MRLMVKSLLLVWASVSLTSLGGLIYVFPGYSLDRAFSEAMRKQASPEGAFWVHWCGAFFSVGICMTLCLYRVYRRQYGKLWGSN
jgi:prolipoprotein diacylglyceryltransferase